MTAPPHQPPNAVLPPATDRRWRWAAGALAAGVVVALVVWVPLVDDLRAPCAGVDAPSCRQPVAALRWGQYLAGLATAVLGVATVGALVLYALRERWPRPATAASLGFVGGAAVWVLLYLVSLPWLV